MLSTVLTKCNTCRRKKKCAQVKFLYKFETANQESMSFAMDTFPQVFNGTKSIL
jgi:hypothetical protein